MRRPRSHRTRRPKSRRRIRRPKWPRRTCRPRPAGMVPVLPLTPPRGQSGPADWADGEYGPPSGNRQVWPGGFRLRVREPGRADGRAGLAYRAAARAVQAPEADAPGGQRRAHRDLAGRGRRGVVLALSSCAVPGDGVVIIGCGIDVTGRSPPMARPGRSPVSGWSSQAATAPAAQPVGHRRAACRVRHRRGPGQRPWQRGADGHPAGPRPRHRDRVGCRDRSGADGHLLPGGSSLLFPCTCKTPGPAA